MHKKEMFEAFDMTEIEKHKEKYADLLELTRITHTLIYQRYLCKRNELANI